MTTIALITGANKGIGFETARLLGDRGMTVLAGARDKARGAEAERALRAGGADARFVALDVTDEESVTQAAGWIDGEYGLLDILVNNAGIARGDGTGLPSQTTLATLRAVYETNVFGVVAVTNAMLPLLRGTGRTDRERLQRGWLDHLDDQPGRPHGGDGLGAVPVVEDRAEHGDRDVREGALRYPDQGQRRQPRLLRHRPQRPRRLPHPTAGSRGQRGAGHTPGQRAAGVLWGHLWTTDGGGSCGVLPW